MSYLFTSESLNKTIVIDYPPGALGHFISQILTNNINYSNQHISFHKSPITIDKQLIVVNEQQFLNKIESWVPTNKVVLSHSFGSIGKLKEKIDCTIIQVVVNEETIYYMLNQHLKANADNRKANIYRTRHMIKHYNNAACWSIRENYCYQYKWLKNENSYIKQPHAEADVIINFDNFYKNQELFFSEINRINDQIDNKLKLYNFFQTTQKSILDKVKWYHSIILAVKNRNKIQLPTNLTLLDQGIISGMLSDVYPQIEWQLPNKDIWFTSTDEMLKLLL
jgi:hypothetical protein